MSKVDTERAVELRVEPGARDLHCVTSPIMNQATSGGLSGTSQEKKRFRVTPFFYTTGGQTILCDAERISSSFLACWKSLLCMFSAKSGWGYFSWLWTLLTSLDQITRCDVSHTPLSYSAHWKAPMCILSAKPIEFLKLMLNLMLSWHMYCSDIFHVDQWFPRCVPRNP